MVIKQTLWVAALLLSLAHSIAQAGLGDFFGSLDPTRAKYETFEGKYLDKVKSADPAPQPVSIADGEDVNETLAAAPSGAGVPEIKGADLVRFQVDSLLGNKRLTGYLQGIIQRLLAGTPWQDSAWTVYVSLNRSHNAQAYPDGTLVLTLPMLLDVESEDELAMLLAHEVSHLILRHHGSDWFVDSQKRLVAASETSLLMAEQMAEKIPQAGADFGDAEQKLKMLALVRDISTDLLFPEWQRGQEEEADLLGLDLMVRAGYNPDEVFTLLEKLQQAAAQAEAEDTAKEGRSEALNQQLQQALQTGGVEGFFTGLGDALMTGLNALREDLKRSHPEFEKRLEFLANYREREYASLEVPATNTKGWSGISRQRSIKSLFADHKRAFEADRQAGMGDVATAAAIIYKLQKGKHRSEPYIQQVSATVRAEQGQRRQAKTHLEKVLNDPRAGYPLFEDLANLYGNAGHPGEAVQVLRKASSRFINLPHLRMSLIYWTSQSGDRATAQKLALDCRLVYPDFDSACAEKLNAPVVRRPVEDLGPLQPKRQLARAEIKQLQTILNRLGYQVGTPDGQPGRKTTQGLSQFQRNARLPVTGRFDEATVAKLYRLNPGI